MPDKKTYTGLSKNYATVPAFSITTIDYLDTKPNYFRVQNRGTTEIYCSTNNMPTTKHYDFAVAGKKMKMFAEPYNRTRLYIFNPSGSDVEVAVLSFQAEFDPLTLALSEIEIEVPSTFETASVINSFNAPLPTGNNKIGKVEVVDGVSGSVVEGINNHTDYIAQLLYWLTDIIPGSEYVNLANVMSELETISLANSLATTLHVTERKNINQDTLIFSSNVSKLITIHMIKNDGDNDLTLEFGDSEATTTDTYEHFTLKAGESINNLKFVGKQLCVKGTKYSFRAITTVKEM